ncbi:MAG: hypothetical protein IJQ59_01310 [Bacteroidaceae bacterium]|nr:hypothetical protein [Bacteroidaceae bacterium]
MWQEVYYKVIDNDDIGIGKRSLPYSVKCKDLTEFKALKHFIGRRGYKCVEQIEGQYAVLINTELKRWCTYPKPASMSCIDDKTLTAEEFMKLI